MEDLPEFKPSVSPLENRPQYMREYRAHYKLREGVKKRMAEYKRAYRYETEYGVAREDFEKYKDYTLCLAKMKKWKAEMPAELWKSMIENVNDVSTNVNDVSTTSQEETETNNTP